MPAAGHQTLRVLDGSYVLDRPADITGVDLRADVLQAAGHRVRRQPSALLAGCG
jgi:hypothetical protein